MYPTKAKIDTAASLSGININHRKDSAFYGQYTVINPAKREELIILRQYATKGQHTACVWLRGGYENRGSGKAGGYGYHRASAAAAEAFQNAKITLDKDISGVGDDAIREALMAIAKAMGCRNPMIIEAGA